MASSYDIRLGGAEWNLPVRYQSVQLIGSGAFGQVAKASLGQSNLQVAIKKLPKAFQNEEHAKRTFRELSVLMYVNHPNLISLLDAFYCPNSNEIYLVTHLMEADLHKVIRTQNLTEEHVRFFLAQILKGLAYIHSRGIIHRDLKPSNIAINGNCHLRILDFGLARAASTEMTGYVVTRWYRAPEVIYSWREYNQAVDIWSVGCILAEMITSRVLFRGTDVWDQLKKILEVVGSPTMDLLNRISVREARSYLAEQPHYGRRDFSDVVGGNASPLAIELLERMLQFDPEKRISTTEALNSSYLENEIVAMEEEFHSIYDQSFETSKFSLEKWKGLIIEKIDQFQPLVAKFEDESSN